MPLPDARPEGGAAADSGRRHLPLPPAVHDLVTKRGYRLLEEGEAPWSTGSEMWMVFLPGHGKGSGETADVAVILPELVAVFAPRLRPAVAGEAAERALLVRTGMMPLPALVFLAGDALMGTIARVRDWQDYCQRIGAIIGGRDAAAPLQ